jgi:hypothetical protein
MTVIYHLICIITHNFQTSFRRNAIAIGTPWMFSICIGRLDSAGDSRITFVLSGHRCWLNAKNAQNRYRYTSDVCMNIIGYTNVVESLSLLKGYEHVNEYDLYRFFSYYFISSQYFTQKFIMVRQMFLVISEIQHSKFLVI